MQPSPKYFFQGGARNRCFEDPSVLDVPVLRTSHFLMKLVFFGKNAKTGFSSSQKNQKRLRNMTKTRVYTGIWHGEMSDGFLGKKDEHLQLGLQATLVPF